MHWQVFSLSVDKPGQLGGIRREKNTEELISPPYTCALDTQQRDMAARQLNRLPRQVSSAERTWGAQRQLKLIRSGCVKHTLPTNEQYMTLRER